MRNYLVFALAFLSGGVFAAAPEDTNVGLGEVGLPVYGATSKYPSSPSPSMTKTKRSAPKAAPGTRSSCSPSA